MEAVVHLFAEKVIKAGIIDAARAQQIRSTCGDANDILVFGEALLEECPEKFEQVQELVNESVIGYRQGERASRDPFQAPARPQIQGVAPLNNRVQSIPPRTTAPRSQSTVDPEPRPKPIPIPQNRPEPEAQSVPQSQPEPQEHVEPRDRPEPRRPVAVENYENPVPPDRKNRPPESVVSAEGIAPAIPDFASLDPGNQEQIASALIGMLLALGEEDYSDLHLSGGSRPFARRFGQLEYLAEEPIDEPLAKAFGLALLSAAQIAYFADFQDYDFAIALDNGRRYRTNLMQHRDGLKITFRLVPKKILTLEELGFGSHIEAIKNMLAYHNGLILLTGPVGCGKTTTLAAMVHELNKTRTDHIICVEDPIEIVHRSDQCSVTQRAVGPHTKNFKSALKGALRQDPDIIVIGDMRDLETIEMAISASETGHLVIGTMHTSDAAMTLNRLLDVFPPSAQPQIRAMVAESLRGIICQRLLPGTNGHPALACEILVKNMAVSALIREGKQAGLGNIMETGKRDGMIQMDACVMQCYQKGIISAETARANIRNEIIRRNIS